MHLESHMDLSPHHPRWNSANVRCSYECATLRFTLEQMARQYRVVRLDHAFFIGVFAIFSTPLPSVQGLSSMLWWAPIGGLVGAVQVYAGLTVVNKVGAGPFVGFTVTAALIASLLVDHFGLFRIAVHAINVWRILGALLMVGGILLIARF